MLDQGVIRPSSSPWSLPLVMVKRKDGSWRRVLCGFPENRCRYTPRSLSPRIDATLDCLSGSSYFTTLDFASGYWQVELEEYDKEKRHFLHKAVILNSTSCCLGSPMPQQHFSN